jgi:hypothetical protein
MFSILLFSNLYFNRLHPSLLDACPHLCWRPVPIIVGDERVADEMAGRNIQYFEKKRAGMEPRPTS